MGFFDLFNGMKGEFLHALILLPIVVTLWVLSEQLYKKRKRKSYAFLSKITLAFLLLNTLTFIVTFFFSVTGKEDSLLISFIMSLSNVSYIAILFGYFRIHTKAALKTQIVFICPAAAGLIVGVFLPWAGDIVCLASVGTLSYLYRRELGRGKQILIASYLFGASLAISAAASIISVTNGSVSLIGAILSLTAYTLLLINLIEHSLVIMQSSYFSAMTDPLTGLFNRRYFTKILSNCVNRNMPVHVIFSDIDNFKNLNDTKGHKVGDEVLMQIATIFMEEVEGIGAAGRYGGEEMVVLIQNTEIDIDLLTEKIRARIETETIATASIGYRLFEAGLAPDILIKQADEAMYKAKTNGKNRVVNYSNMSQFTGVSSSSEIGKVVANHG